MSYLVPLIAVVFVVVVGCYLASVPQEEDHQYLIVILGLIVPLVIVAIGMEVWKFSGKGVVGTETRSLGGLEFSEFVHDSQRMCPRYQLPLSAILRSYSRQLLENPAIQRSEALCLRCLHEECQLLLPEKVMASGKNGDDGDLLLFRDGLGACDISAGALRLFISWECSRPVAGVKVNSGSGNWVAREVGESILLGMECLVAASCSGELSGMLLESD
ncbi:hypothetical protein Tco_0198941 [Tanacetum coccineum]